jgi:ATPase subunit of ABC transporter with duplicated ATPase domains
MVSHDRYFINELCDHLIVFEPTRVFVFPGNYEQYRLQRPLEGLSEPEKPAETNHRSRSQSPNQVLKRKRQFPYRKVNAIEADIASHESRIEELHFELANPSVLRDEHKIKSVKNELVSLKNSLQMLYDHWEEAMELN